MVSFAVGQADLSEGLRAACASTAMLLLGNILHMPEFSWAAIGAFWTCLADAAGSSRMRFASMMAFSVLSTLCGGLTAYAAGVGAFAATMAVLSFAFLGALGRIFGVAAAQVSILAATACVVMVDHPVHGGRAEWRFLGIYLVGCLFATALSFTVWRIHPFGASSAAIRATYLRLADIARDSARLLKKDDAKFAEWASHAAQFRAQARKAIEETRNALERIPASKKGRRQTFDNLLLALADAEQLFAYLIAVTDACERRHRQLPDSRRATRVLDTFAEVLLVLARSLGERPWESTAPTRDRLNALAARLDVALGEAVPLRFDIDFSELGPATNAHPTWWSAIGPALVNGARTLRANASLGSLGVRHAGRVGVATTAAFLIMQLLHVPFGYWATMATLLILQPSIATSWPRSIERAAGSIVGGLLAAAIGLVVHSPIAISLVVFPLVCATMALRPVSYSLFVLFITPTFVLVADFASPGGTELAYAMTRLGNNVLGCVIALAATFLLWPSREPHRLKDGLLKAVNANLRYLATSLSRARADTIQLERLRRAAGLASNNAEDILSRLQLEKLQTPAADRTALTLFALLRRMAGTATRARFSSTETIPNEHLAARILAVSGGIAERLGHGAENVGDDVFAKSGLSAIQSDAVNQVTLLRRILHEHADALKGR